MDDAPANDAQYRLIRDVVFDDDVTVLSFTNLYAVSAPIPGSVRSSRSSAAPS